MRSAACGMQTERSWRRRAASAVLVLLVHLGIVAVFLDIRVSPPPRPAEQETVLVLPEAPAAKPGAVARAARPNAITLPSYVWTTPDRPVTPDISGLGDTLFACRPEHLDLLSQEQRAHCMMALGPTAEDRRSAYRSPRSDSRYDAIWAASVARRNEPVRVPCVSAVGGRMAAVTPNGAKLGGPPAAQKPGLGVDFLCTGRLVWHALKPLIFGDDR